MVDPKKVSGARPEQMRDILRRLAQMVSFLLVAAVLLFWSAGTLRWLWAWLYLAVSVAIPAINSRFINLELAAERGRKKEDVERWDPIVSGLILLPWLALYLVAGLDYRWGWSLEMGLGWHLAGLVFYVLGNALTTWAMLANPFFSTAVRIQFDRGHTVMSGGPYKYVRHPGYLGMIVYIMASPLIFGSLWALLPALVASALFMLRTGLEDKTLHQKLPGYQQYAAHTRYRLLPGLW